MFTRTVAGAQFRGGIQTVSKVGKGINYKGSPLVCVIYVWSETRHVSVLTWRGGPREDSSKPRCFWRIFTMWQLWQKPTPTPCPGSWYLTYRDMFLTHKKNRVEIRFVSLQNYAYTCGGSDDAELFDWIRPSFRSHTSPGVPTATGTGSLRIVRAEPRGTLKARFDTQTKLSTDCRPERAGVAIHVC